MRRLLAEYREGRPRGGLPSPRLMTMFLMLIVVSMIYYTARDPSRWTWFATADKQGSKEAPGPRAEGASNSGAQKADQKPKPPEPRKPGPGKAAPPKAERPAADDILPPPIPALGPPPAAKAVAVAREPAGPTDADKNEQTAIKKEQKLIDDGTLLWHREESIPFNRVLGWAEHQSLERLRSRAKKDKDVVFGHFLSKPADMRFRLVEIPLTVRQVIGCESEGVTSGKLYEVRGLTPDNRLCFGVVEGLPDGMPTGSNIEEQASLVGYFFKLQGYYPASTKEKGKPLQAPVLIGRLAWKPAPIAKSAAPGVGRAKPPKGEELAKAEESALPPAPEEKVTDEDADEQAAIINEAKVIEDGTTHWEQVETFPFQRVMVWVASQTTKTLRSRAKKDVLFDDLIHNPDNMRFRIVEIPLSVRQVSGCEIEGFKGKEIYEVRGFTTENRLYYGLVEGLPKGMPVGINIQQPAILVGYFFKVQGYHPGDANAKSKPLKAPVIVGRLVWLGVPVAQSDESAEGGWGLQTDLILIGIFAIGGGVVLWTIYGRRRGRPALCSGQVDAEAPSVDRWLDMAQAGDMPPGNNSAGNGESTGGYGYPPLDEAEQDRPRRFPGDSST